MNSISVSGKNWKYKVYNQEEINYLKDNYFLDEITSKLISIRKIKKEEITNFLNPSIKNFLPNPEVLKDMKKTTQRILESIKKNEKMEYEGRNFINFDAKSRFSNFNFANFDDF